MLELLPESPAALAGLVFVFGLLIGSFLNVVILRLPPRLEWEWRRDSRELLELPEHYEPAPPDIVVQRSACPKCGHRLAAWENIPVLSFLMLRGRCRGCGTAISWQYPAVELVTGLMFAACVWRFGASPEALAAMVFSGLLVARRSDNGYRDYPAEAADWLRYIRTAQALGFTLQEIEADMPLLSAPGGDSASALRTALQSKLAEIDRRIDGLQALRGELARRLGAPMADCPLRPAEA